MPEIARGQGIVIRIRAEPRAQHHLPHYHAFYSGHQASFGIDPFGLLTGNFPNRQQGILEDWTAQHVDALLDNWNRAQSGQATYRIPGP